MTHKEKAIELTDKFKPLVTIWDCYHDAPEDEELILKDAKKCALIAVEELIKEHTFKSPIGWNVKQKAYWESVKKEISSL